MGDFEVEEIAEDTSPKYRSGLYAAACLLGAAIVAYCLVSIFFIGHFAPGTHVNDVNISYMSVDDARSAIRGDVKHYTLALELVDGASDYISGGDIGLTALQDDNSDEEALTELCESQFPLLWVRGCAVSENSVINLPVTYDTNKFEEVVSSLSCVQPENQVEPVDAHIEYVKDRYEIIPESIGSTIKGDQLRKVVDSAILTHAEEIDLMENDCYELPKVLKDDASLAALSNYYNDHCRMSVTYDVSSDDAVALERETIVSWVALDDKNNAYLDESKVDEYVSDMASKYDSVGKTRTFTTHSGGTVDVSGGNYGWELDNEGEKAQLLEDIAAGTPVERQPVWLQTAASLSPEWGSTYLEVSLSEQHVWYFVDGNVAWESDCITGVPNSERATPTGLWILTEKLSPTVLRGDSWEVGVQYWMRVTWDGVGFHDATWQPGFGGNMYASGYGSHGCINLPYSAAESLYGMVEVGTPIIIYD